MLRRIDATHYEELFKDGSKYVYAQADQVQTPPSYPLRLFLTQVVDRHGNAVVLGYDAEKRLQLTTITDAVGNPPTTISYYDDGQYGPNHIKQVTDPFGRAASFQYDTDGRLIQITDPIGIASQFTYADVTVDPTADPHFITKLTTPYGDIIFQTSNGGPISWIQATDANGGVERVETVDNAPGIAATEDPAVVPTGFAGANQGLNVANTYYWNKKAMQSAVGPGGALDYTKARITHWLISADGAQLSGIPGSEKSALENRVWYQYSGQPDLQHVGSNDSRSQVARVLDDGTTQLSQAFYNSLGNVIRTIDPLGRSTSFTYDPANDIDMTEVRQTTGGINELLAKYTYYPNHLVHTATDASGRTSGYSYTSQGMLLTSTNAKSEVTTLVYGINPSSTANDYQRLKQVIGPVPGATKSFSYDSQQRLRTVTDSENYTLTYDYDAIGGDPTKTLSRLSKVTYPDGTYGQVLYNLLDPEWTRDRLGRWTYKTYDALEHLLSVTDPENRSTQFTWCSCGALESIIDANNNTTTFIRDLESRVQRKIFADTIHSIDYTYENSSGRVHTITDALGQVTTCSYFIDDNPKHVQYSNAVHPTPNVSFTYDPNYNRIVTMADGTGTTTWNYNPITATPALGAGRLANVAGPVANSTVAFTYDELGRTLTQSINGAANSTTIGYDALGRVKTTANPLGTFNYGYVNQTGRLSSGTFPNGQTVNFSYFDNIGDRRLQEISNLDPAGTTVISKFNYTYDAAGRIKTWKQTNSAAANPQQFALGYDGSDWLTGASLVSLATSGTTLLDTLHYGYDAAGNRTSEQASGRLTTWTANNLNQLASQAGGNALHVGGAVSKPAAVDVNGVFAPVDGELNFSADVPVTDGSNTIAVTAASGSGQMQTNRYGVQVSQGASKTFGYDLDGNMTDNGGTQTYEWDAVNRLVAINYTGTTNRTEFVYNGLGQRVSIVEKSGGSVTSRKQFVWVPGAAQPSEERGASNNVIKRFYGQGEQISGTNYYYTTDHLGSIREMTDGSGTVVARYDYHLYGHRVKVSGSIDVDFGYAGYYIHTLSGLDLTMYRVYNPELGRWISRDPIAEAGGINLYGYVDNSPISGIDPSGLESLKLHSEERGLTGFGHSWVSLTNKDGIERSYGYWPDGGIGWLSFIGGYRMPGMVTDGLGAEDSAQTADHSISFYIDTDTYNRILAGINKYNQSSTTFSSSSNCTDFTSMVAAWAHINTGPVSTLGMADPNALANWIYDRNFYMNTAPKPGEPILSGQYPPPSTPK